MAASFRGRELAEEAADEAQLLGLLLGLVAGLAQGPQAEVAAQGGAAAVVALLIEAERLGELQARVAAVRGAGRGGGGQSAKVSATGPCSWRRAGVSMGVGGGATAAGWPVTSATKRSWMSTGSLLVRVGAGDAGVGESSARGRGLPRGGRSICAIAC